MRALALSKIEIEKFDIMFQKYGDQLYRLTWRYIKDAQLAEDALQEAFFQLARHMDKIDDPHSIAAKNYAYKIAENIAKEFYYKKKNQENVTSPYDDTLINMMDELRANEILASQEIDDLLDECVGKLSSPEQNILDLKYGQGWDDIQIADILGITYEAARQRLCRAKIHLSTLISKQRVEDSRNERER